MKTNIFLIAILSLGLVACENNNAPEIDFHELGMENSKTATAGEDLHMDAEIVTENTIDRIEVEIHHENEHSHMKGTFDEGEWEVDTVYTEFSGLKNTKFHEHLEVPVTAEAGEYHFYFKVTDMEGYQTVYEDEIEILEPAGSK